MNSNRDVAVLVARILLSFMFIWAGWSKITGFEGTVGYIASKGLPLPQLMAIGAIVVELGGGLLLLLGYKARWAALALFLFLIPTTLIFHSFWAVPPEQVMAQKTNFMKNFTIMGGMLMVWAFGPGRLSLDRTAA
jgi:putative oxidoreductase